MYTAIENFLSVATWHTAHPLDEQRFFRALDNIVWEAGFNADDMAAYMRTWLKLPPNDQTSPFAIEVEHYREKAWAVSEFIKCTGLSQPQRSEN